MCSKRWAKPVRPGSSFAGPTWYQTFTPTMGSRLFSQRITSRPFGSSYFTTFILTLGGCEGLAGAAEERSPAARTSARAGAMRLQAEGLRALPRNTGIMVRSPVRTASRGAENNDEQECIIRLSG